MCIEDVVAMAASKCELDRYLHGCHRLVTKRMLCCIVAGSESGRSTAIKSRNTCMIACFISERVRTLEFLEDLHLQSSPEPFRATGIWSSTSSGTAGEVMVSCGDGATYRRGTYRTLECPATLSHASLSSIPLLASLEPFSRVLRISLSLCLCLCLSCPASASVSYLSLSPYVFFCRTRTPWKEACSSLWPVKCSR